MGLRAFGALKGVTVYIVACDGCNLVMEREDTGNFTCQKCGFEYTGLHYKKRKEGGK